MTIFMNREKIKNQGVRKMSKKEKQIFKIIINEFPNFDICEDIFDIGVEYFGGGMEH